MQAADILLHSDRAYGLYHISATNLSTCRMHPQAWQKTRVRNEMREYDGRKKKVFTRAASFLTVASSTGLITGTGLVSRRGTALRFNSSQIPCFVTNGLPFLE
jgi:hypothetical protein